MRQLEYIKQNRCNWYLSIKEADIKYSEFKLIENISDKIVGGAFGALATSILLTALYRSNVNLYDQVQNKEITIESAVQQELPNRDFVKEVVKIAPEGAFEDNRDDFSVYVQGWEGFLDKPKILASEKFYTIGIGHRLDGSDRSRSAFLRALPGKNYDSFYMGNGRIDKDEANRLFEEDMPDYIDRAHSLTGDKFSSYSVNLQKNIVSATYRGSWGYSPKTRRLLSEGKYEEAAVEFLNSDEYRDADKLGRPGIRERMEAVSDAIRLEARFRNWK
jgi:hypothetical protein